MELLNLLMDLLLNRCSDILQLEILVKHGALHGALNILHLWDLDSVNVHGQ